MPRFILPILLLLSLNVAAQKQNNNWCFGNIAGLSFNTNPPTSFGTNMYTYEGCATMSNRHTGDLMFYTNGIDIWDKTHNIMPNGQDIGNERLSKGTSTQGVVIVPFVNDTNKYYLFTLSTRPGRTLRYSVVDMSLNGGLGDIVGGQKATAIDSGFAEGMTVVPTCNGYWVIVLIDFTTDFYAYRVTKNGVNSTPVVSKIKYDNLAVELYANLRAAPNGKKIALASPNNSSRVPKYKPFISLQNFDNSTGVLSNGIVIDSGEYTMQYNSCEFSPNSVFLYATTYGLNRDTPWILQYNVSLNTAPLIKASRKVIAKIGASSGIQLGADNDIYIASWGYSLGAITNSNLPYPNCTYVPQAISITQGHSFYGLPQKIVYNDTPTSLTTRRLDTALCVNTGYRINANTKYKLHLWEDGSTLKYRDIKQPGKYWVWMADTDTGCISYVDTFVVNERKDTTHSRRDTTICFNNALTLTAKVKSTGATYEWSTLDSDKQITVSKEGLVWVRITEPCRIARDSTFINFKGIPVRVGNDTTICVGDTLLLAN
ncbi:MAG TPA: hypothetical protein VIN07_05880, partial [Flavipsychrobacter sp.]